ncbi:MAG: YfcE family phosphodiesterase [Clostridia bacterium]|nr:YfcE family phosphodiesterase [Clostridia bacterium]
MESILVLSDIHAGRRRAEEVVAAHPSCKTVFFLGDGVSAFVRLCEKFPDRAYFAVCGNCDFSIDGADTRESVLEICGHRIFLTHGDAYGVKGGVGGLIAAARARGADIALFGHTHRRHEEYVSEYGLYLFNPGSIGAARDGAYSYGILTLDEKNVLFSFGEVE